MNTRNTFQRALILDTVRGLKCHATADEVYNAVVKIYPHIGRATVYRNLSLLCGLGEIQKREIPGGPDRYDHLCHDHYHARCLKCGRVFDVDMAVMADLETKIADTRGFAFTGHDIMFKGICPACNP